MNKKNQHKKIKDIFNQISINEMEMNGICWDGDREEIASL